MSFRFCVLLLSSVCFAPPLNADALSDAIASLKSVEAGGQGSAAARAAIETIAKQGEKSLMPVLEAFQDASPLSANWLRNAFEEAANQHLASGKSLPVKPLEKFVLDQKQSPVARRLLYETLLNQDPGLADRLIPGMVLDPSPEFRRDAVARLIDEATKLTEPEKSTPLYEKALSGAVHEDQVKTIAEALRKNGKTVDLQSHFGFVSSWMIAGPFDNKEEKGFAIAYAPESEVTTTEGVNLEAEYDGQLGKVKWQPLATKDDFGLVDIAKQIQNYKGSVMYASATWTSDRDRQIEIRLGTPNAWKLWINGQQVFEREEYHRSSKIDQYRVPVTLRSGQNKVLLKVCQNEQTQEWAQDYQFQLRFCDATGAAVLPARTASSDNSSGATR